MRSFELVLAFAAAVAAVPAGELFNRAGCNADNCLRAIRNTNRPGLADCSSFLASTVTPATSTEFSTTTFSATPTQTFMVTGTVTNLVTATEVVTQTNTKTATNSVAVTPWLQLNKRQVTETPSNIPTYATACSGSVRYTSACACLGAEATTITVAAPTTTVTVSETVTPTTASEYITVQTDQVTVTDATVTNTETQTATTTVNVPGATITPFYARINGGPRNGEYLYVLQFASSGYTLSTTSNTNSRDRTFYINAAGGLQLLRGSDISWSALSVDDDQSRYFYLNPNGPRNDPRPQCHITSDMKLICKPNDEPSSGFATCDAWSRRNAVLWNGKGVHDVGSQCYSLDIVVEYTTW